MAGRSSGLCRSCLRAWVGSQPAFPLPSHWAVHAKGTGQEGLSACLQYLGRQGLQWTVTGNRESARSLAVVDGGRLGWWPRVGTKV